MFENTYYIPFDGVESLQFYQRLFPQRRQFGLQEIWLTINIVNSLFQIAHFVNLRDPWRRKQICLKGAVTL